MIVLELSEALELHRRLIEQSGGAHGVRDMGLLQSALAQPLIAFGGQELYPTLVDKAAALGFSLIKNHPFVDGNKRLGHAAMEAFFVCNGQEINAPVDEQEAVILSVASGQMNRESFTTWLAQHIQVKS